MFHCRICQHETQDVINLGPMPIANGFLDKVVGNDVVFNLIVVFCPSCLMVQLKETVPPEKMFNDHYHFMSSTSTSMAVHFKGNAEEIMTHVAARPDPFVVELGCNDGIMLKHIAAKGIRHLGIEPSGNVADLAAKNNVQVLKAFFNKSTAENIIKKHGKADVICGSNVFCHIEDINSVFAGLATLLKDDGYVYFEDPYLKDIVQKSSFDQIYDEHVFYYCGLSVRELARRHQLELVDMVHQDVHGGSMRYYLKKGTHPKAEARVAGMIDQEKALQLDQMTGYKMFKDNVNQVCKDLKEILSELKKKGNRILGYGATSKSTTLLNYAKIGPELVDYISDNTPYKINKLTPGTHIPIKSYATFVKDNPPYTLLLAWNHKREIFEKEKSYRQSGGKFITFFPKVMIE